MEYVPDYVRQPTGGSHAANRSPAADLAIEQQDLADSQAWEKLQADIDGELSRLLELGKREYQKRRNTITALAWAAVTPSVSINQALAQPGTVSRGIFYNPKKDWWHNDLFQDVLTAVTDLVRTYEENRSRRLLEWRRRHFLERTYELSIQMLDRVEEMNQWPLSVEIQEKEEEIEGDDGIKTVIYRTTIEPAKWTQNTAGMNLIRATRIGRQALGLDDDDASTGNEPPNPVVIVTRQEWDDL